MNDKKVVFKSILDVIIISLLVFFLTIFLLISIVEYTDDLEASKRFQNSSSVDKSEEFDDDQGIYLMAVIGIYLIIAVIHCVTKYSNCIEKIKDLRKMILYKADDERDDKNRTPVVNFNSEGQKDQSDDFFIIPVENFARNASAPPMET